MKLQVSKNGAEIFEEEIKSSGSVVYFEEQKKLVIGWSTDSRKLEMARQIYTVAGNQYRIIDDNGNTTFMLNA